MTIERQDGVTYRPFHDGDKCGYVVTGNGKTEYIYFVPSSETDDGVPNVFVYQGTHGDPVWDAPVHHYVNLDGGTGLLRQGVVINDGGVVDWTTPAVVVVDFEDCNARLKSDNPDDWRYLLDLLEEVKSAGIFPQATLDDLGSLCLEANQKLGRENR